MIQHFQSAYLPTTMVQTTGFNQGPHSAAVSTWDLTCHKQKMWVCECVCVHTSEGQHQQQEASQQTRCGNQDVEEKSQVIGGPQLVRTRLPAHTGLRSSSRSLEDTKMRPDSFSFLKKDYWVQVVRAAAGGWETPHYWPSKPSLTPPLHSASLRSSTTAGYFYRAREGVTRVFLPLRVSVGHSGVIFEVMWRRTDTWYNTVTPPPHLRRPALHTACSTSLSLDLHLFSRFYWVIDCCTLTHNDCVFNSCSFHVLAGYFYFLIRLMTTCVFLFAK